MRQKQQYERGRQKTSFKPASQALINAVAQIRQQSKTEIGALKDLQIQQRNIDDQQISHQSKNNAFQQESQKSVFRLYDQSRELIKENTQIRANREVEHLKGVAKEYEKKAIHLAQLAPKQAEMYKNIFHGIYDFSEALETRYLQKELAENQNVDWQNSDSFNEAMRILAERQDFLTTNRADAIKATIAKGQDPEELENLIENGLITPKEFERSHRETVGRDNKTFGLQIEDQFKANKNTIVAEMHATFDEKGITLSKANVAEWYEEYAYGYLAHKKLSPNSKSGKKILANFSALARLKSIQLDNKDKSDITERLKFDLSNKLRVTPDDVIRQQLFFNELVLAIDTGTFTDGRGKYWEGPRNLRKSAVEALKFHVANARTDFQSEQDVIDYISSLVIFNKEEAKQFAEDTRSGRKLAWSVKKALVERHPDVIDEVVGAWAKDQLEDATRRRARGPAEDTQNELDSDKRWEEHQVNKDRGYKIEEVNGEEKQIPYNQTDDQFWNNEILLASRLRTGTIASKNYIYNNAVKFLDIQGLDNSVAAKFSRIKAYELDGDHDAALMEYRQTTPTQREKLRHLFERYQRIYDSGWTFDGKKGAYAFNAKAKSIVEAAEQSNAGKKQLSDSAKGIIEVMSSRVEQKVDLIIGAEDFKGNARQVIDDVWKEEIEEFNKGINSSKPSEYGEGFYARKRAYYRDVDGAQLPWSVYEMNDLSSPNSANLSILNDWRIRNKDGTLAEASEEIKNLDVDEYDPETVRLMTKFGYISYENWIKNDHLVSPRTVTKLADTAERLHEGLSSSFPSIEVPENIKVLAKLTGKTDVEVINDILEQNGYEYRFSDDGSEAGKIRNDGKIDYGTSLYGKTLAQSAKAQGIIPMREWVRSSIEGGLTVSEAFKQSLDIGTYTDFEGNTKLTDYAKFFKENGVSKDPTFDWKGEFGLTGIANTKKAAYRELLRRKAQSKPIK